MSASHAKDGLTRDEQQFLLEFAIAAKLVREKAKEGKRGVLKMHFQAKAEILGLTWKAYLSNSESPYLVDSLLTAWGA